MRRNNILISILITILLAGMIFTALLDRDLMGKSEYSINEEDNLSINAVIEEGASISVNMSEANITSFDEEDLGLLDKKITMTHIYPTKIVLYKDSSKTASYENVDYHIEKDNLIIQVPYSMSETALKNAYLDLIVENGSYELVDASSYVDLTSKPKITLKLDNGKTESYTITTEYLTSDMPVLYVRTAGNTGVNSRTEYVSANLVIDDKEYDIEIRGRGNVSWWGYDQHGYMLKFDEKLSLFGYYPSDKYCVLSTYGDTSLVRNVVAMNMASCMDNMEFVPRQRMIDMFIDGKYMGVFTFSEKIDLSMDKVNLFSDYSYDEAKKKFKDDDPYDDLSFLIELGGYSKESHSYGLDHFSTMHIHDAFVKAPEADKLTAEVSNNIRSYLRTVDQIISVRGNYADYIELDDWVDWFIVMEYTNSTDSAFARSTYLYKKPGSKLYLGPVWDFDKALGNYGMDNHKYDTWASTESDYAAYQNNLMHSIYMSNAFMEAVKARWDIKKDEMKALGLDALDDAADDVAYSRVYNDRLYNKPGAGMINQIRRFLNTRYNWIDASIHSANYNRHPDRPTINLNKKEE